MARTMAADSNRIVTKEALDVEIPTNTLYSMIKDSMTTTGGKAYKGEMSGHGSNVKRG